MDTGAYLGYAGLIDMRTLRIALFLLLWATQAPAASAARSRDEATRRVGPSSSSAAASEIRGLLESQDRIRVFFSAAPGFGHQSATLAIARHLRELGFKGEIEGVYFDRDCEWRHDQRPTSEKLAVLIPRFDPKRWEDQKIPKLNMTLRSYSSFAKRNDPVGLAITGGLDYLQTLQWNLGIKQKHFGDIFNAEFFLRLSPKGWDEYQDELWIRGASRPKRIPTTDHHQLLYKPASRAEAAREIASLPEGPKKDGLRALLGGLQGRALLPAYALDLGFTSAEAVHRLLLGLSEAMESSDFPLSDGVVVPLLCDLQEKMPELEHILLHPGSSREISKLSPERRKRIDKANDRLRERLKMVSIEADWLPEELTQLAPGQILFVKVGPVPPLLFEYLFRRSSLPPTLAGRNAVSLARMLGIPFLSKYQADLNEVAGASPLGPDPAVERLLAGRSGKGLIDSWVNNRNYDFESLADFIRAAVRPRSALRRAFRAARIRPNDPSYDKLALGLRQIQAVKTPPSKN